MRRSLATGLFVLVSAALFPSIAACDETELAVSVLPVSDVREGMRGIGRTVLKGTELTEFAVEILGVLRVVSPGRDMILARLSGAGLEHTGVIGGMSGSPVYIDGKLVGAVAFTWPFNKEPIAGITPFEQMRSFAAQRPATTAAIEPDAEGAMPVWALDLARDPYEGLAGGSAAVPIAAAGGGAAMRRIAIPLSASGFSERSLAELTSRFAPLGLVPVAAGGAAANVLEEAAGTPLVPGSVLAASMIVGDFDLSGIGTVTHVEGNRVWGWGHPFMENGGCGYVLSNGYVHLVNPKLDISTKMASPMAALGVVHADVSTCIAGELGCEADLLPVTITVQQGADTPPQTYRVKIVREPTMAASLITTVLTNALDGAGALDQEITLDVDATVQAAGLAPIELKNSFSGGTVAGTQGVRGTLGQIAVIADGLIRNPFEEVQVDSIDCNLTIHPRRCSAAIVSMRLGSDRYEPGDELVAQITLRPFKASPIVRELRLPLPKSLPPGTYTATVCDAPAHLKEMFVEEPHLLVAKNVKQIADAFRLQLAEDRRTLYLRVLLPDTGLTSNEVTLPQLPVSARAVFNSRRASPTRPIRRSHVARLPTEWVIEGSTSLPFTVVEEKG